jgi:hypothetical protein
MNFLKAARALTAAPQILPVLALQKTLLQRELEGKI